MKLNRRSFLGVLAGAVCSVLATVYGVSQGDEEVGEYRRSEMERFGPVTEEKLERAFAKYFDNVVQTSYCPPGVMYFVDMSKVSEVMA